MGSYYDDVFRGSPDDPIEPTEQDRVKAKSKIMRSEQVLDEYIDYPCKMDYEAWIDTYKSEEIEELAYELANKL